MKKMFLLRPADVMALLCASVLAFAACSGGGDNPATLPTTQSTSQNQDNDIVTAKTLILGNFSAAESAAFKRRFPNADFSTSSISDVDESYKVVISDFSDMPNTIADDAFFVLYTLDGNAFNGIRATAKEEHWTDEEKARLEKDIADWPYFFLGKNFKTDNSLKVRKVETEEEWNKFYTFIGATDNTVVEEPGDIGADETGTENQKLSDEDSYYVMFRPVAQWILESKNDSGDQTLQNAAISFATANGATGNYDIAKSDVFKKIHERVSFSWRKTYQVDKWKGYRGDYIWGAGSWTIAISYIPVWITDSQGADGLYYAMSTTTNIASSKMYAGRKGVGHGGFLHRYVGMYLTKFDQSFVPSASGTENNVQKHYEVQIPDSCGPRPETTNGAKEYSSGFDWGLEGKAHYSKNKDGNEGGLELGGKFSYSSKETYKVEDMNIVNVSDKSTSSGAEVDCVRYRLDIGNTPEYDSIYYPYYKTPSAASTSTATFHTAWMWRVPGTWTKENLPTVSVKVEGRANYQSQAFRTSKADLETRNNDDTYFSQTIILKNP